jgi:hypothetical protein
MMSARNGDKSRFNRERKQKIARRKRTHELLVYPANAGPANARKPENNSNRVQPRSVSA